MNDLATPHVKSRYCCTLACASSQFAASCQSSTPIDTRSVTSSGNLQHFCCVWSVELRTADVCVHNHDFCGCCHTYDQLRKIQWERCRKNCEPEFCCHKSSLVNSIVRQGVYSHDFEELQYGTPSTTVLARYVVFISSTALSQWSTKQPLGNQHSLVSTPSKKKDRGVLVSLIVISALVYDVVCLSEVSGFVIGFFGTSGVCTMMGQNGRPMPASHAVPMRGSSVGDVVGSDEQHCLLVCMAVLESPGVIGHIPLNVFLFLTARILWLQPADILSVSVVKKGIRATSWTSHSTGVSRCRNSCWWMSCGLRFCQGL